MKFLRALLEKRAPYFLFFYRHLRGKFFGLLALSLLVGALEGFGLAVVLPLLEIIVKPELRDQDFLLSDLKLLGNFFQGFDIELSMTSLFAWIVFFFLLKGIIKYSSGYINLYYVHEFTKSLRIQTLNYFDHYRYEAFVKGNAGRVNFGLSSGITRVVMAYNDYNRVINALIMFLLYSLFAIYSNPRFAILVITGGLFSYGVFNILGRKIKEISRALVKGSINYQRLLLQIVVFFKYLKATNLIGTYSSYLKSEIRRIEGLQMKINAIKTITESIREPFMVILLLGLIFLYSEFFGRDFAGILLSLLFFYRSLTASVQFQQHRVAFANHAGYLEDHVDFKRELISQAEKSDHGKQRKSFAQSLQLQAVSYAYEVGKPILQDINLQLHKNESLAFVGESGSGKTTLLNIIAGLIEPQHGDIWLDETNLADCDKGYFQSRIGYITQEPVVFDDSVFNNVSFFDQHTPANVERMWSALAKADLEDHFRAKGLDEQAMLGTNGVNLSGGQKQRISIARELYKEVDLLLLDEATSALDSLTEGNIQKNIEALKGRVTMVIIAHRLSTILNADRIAVFDKGRIVAVGTYAELMETSPLFQAMANSQQLL